MIDVFSPFNRNNFSVPFTLPNTSAMYAITIDGTSGNFTFTGAEGEYNVYILDGSEIVKIYRGLTDEETITFETNSEYNLFVEPTGVNPFHRIRFNNGGDRLKILDIFQWGDVIWSSMDSAYYGCSNLDISATDIPNLSEVTSLFRMFRGCNSLIFNDSVENWDVSTIETFSEFLRDAPLFNQPLNDWILTSAELMVAMFSNSGMSDENYTNTLVSWGNQAFDNGGFPNGVDARNQNNMNFLPFNSGGDNFNNAIDVRDYLIDDINWLLDGDQIFIPSNLIFSNLQGITNIINENDGTFYNTFDSLNTTSDPLPILVDGDSNIYHTYISALESDPAKSLKKFDVFGNLLWESGSGVSNPAFQNLTGLAGIIDNYIFAYNSTQLFKFDLNNGALVDEISLITTTTNTFINIQNNRIVVAWVNALTEPFDNVAVFDSNLNKLGGLNTFSELTNFRFAPNGNIVFNGAGNTPPASNPRSGCVVDNNGNLLHILNILNGVVTIDQNNRIYSQTNSPMSELWRYDSDGSNRVFLPIPNNGAFIVGGVVSHINNRIIRTSQTASATKIYDLNANEIADPNLRAWGILEINNNYFTRRTSGYIKKINIDGDIIWTRQLVNAQGLSTIAPFVVKMGSNIRRLFGNNITQIIS